MVILLLLYSCSHSLTFSYLPFPPSSHAVMHTSPFHPSPDNSGSWGAGLRSITRSKTPEGKNLGLYKSYRLELNIL
ncbi:hypothetical protein F4810DRAFT_691750 [Camillea tinctor]|nr:hypothetical protein F4810DRAFT_691750 [Camillea tinctor]